MPRDVAGAVPLMNGRARSPPLSRDTLKARVAAIDEALGQTTYSLAIATLEGRVHDVDKLERAIASGEAERKRCLLAIEQAEKMAQEATAMKREQERHAALDAAARDHEAGRPLLAAVDSALDSLMAALDAVQRHAEAQEAHSSVLSLDYHRQLVAYHEVAQCLLSGNSALAHVLQAGPMIRTKTAVPIVSTYPSFEDIRLDAQASSRQQRDARRREEHARSAADPVDAIIARQNDRTDPVHLQARGGGGSTIDPDPSSLSTSMNSLSPSRADAALAAAAALRVEMQEDAA